MFIHWKDITMREQNGRYRVQVTGGPPVFLYKHKDAEKLVNSLREGHKPPAHLVKSMIQVIGYDRYNKKFNKKQKYINNGCKRA